MLQRIRDSLQGQRWVAYIVLGVLAVVFAAWGAYGIVELNFGGAPYAAKVEGEKIPIERARNAWMQQQAVWIDRLGGNDLPEELKTRLQDQLLEDFVRSTLLKQRADELGYAVTDKQLREAIAREPAFQIDGKYSPEVAKAALARVGLSPAAFEADLRENLQQRQVQSAISISNFLTPYEMQRMTALQEEERQVQFITLPAEKFAGKLSLSDAEIEKAYQENLSRYMNPEYVRLAYAELRTDQLAAQVTVTDQEISDFYEKSKDRFVTPEKRHVRHILISVEGNKEDEARKEAEQVLA
ncbi:MAG TPA: SurA N-terminal domain-containing protein, partial [Steroidobacteraceae bacterium]